VLAEAPPAPRAARPAVLGDALGIGLATGAYALSFGALSVAAGLSVIQTCALSLLMFTGASQFALVGVIASGGGPLAAAATATLLGTRNALYAVRLASLLGVRRERRAAAAQLVIDESTAMAVARDDVPSARFAFYATGLSVFVLWNLGTLIGALGGEALGDPRALGLDAAAPAAFLALMAPQVRSGGMVAIALIAAFVALASVPFVPAGVPVMLGALVAAVAGLRGAGAARGDGGGPPASGPLPEAAG
jgi:predicted branched-subunit amino acid permease